MPQATSPARVIGLEINALRGAFDHGLDGVVPLPQVHALVFKRPASTNPTQVLNLPTRESRFSIVLVGALRFSGLEAMECLFSETSFLVRQRSEIPSKELKFDAYLAVAACAEVWKSSDPLHSPC